MSNGISEIIISYFLIYSKISFSVRSHWCSSDAIIKTSINEKEYVQCPRLIHRKLKKTKRTTFYAIFCFHFETLSNNSIQETKKKQQKYCFLCEILFSFRNFARQTIQYNLETQKCVLLLYSWLRCTGIIYVVNTVYFGQIHMAKLWCVRLLADICKTLWRHIERNHQ